MPAEPGPVTVLDLCGADGLVREALRSTWQWYAGATVAGDVPGHDAADAAAATATAPGWLRATVPGSVVADLHRAGEVPDPYVGRNTEAVLATAGSGLSPLLDVPRACVGVEGRMTGERWLLSVRHLRGPVVVGLKG